MATIINNPSGSNPTPEDTSGAGVVLGVVIVIVVILFVIFGLPYLRNSGTPAPSAPATGGSVNGTINVNPNLPAGTGTGGTSSGSGTGTSGSENTNS